MVESAQGLATLFFSPIGVFVLIILVAILVWRGEFRLKREYQRLDNENAFIRSLLRVQVQTGEVNAEVAAKAVLLSELRAKGELP